MKFWYTEKVAYLITILTLIIPYGIMYQIISEDSYNFVMMSAIWQYTFRTPDVTSFTFHTYGIIFILWWGSSLYIAKMAYDATKKGNWMRYDYAVRIVIVLAIQLAISWLIPFYNGSPPPLNIPVPIPGVIALLLTRLTVKEPTKVWDDSPADVPAEDEVFKD